MTPAVRALLAAHPAYDEPAATAWVAARRADLLARSDRGRMADAGSSGCAARGGRDLADQQADAAAEALARLDTGLALVCSGCGTAVPLERLTAVPTTTCCVGCAPTRRA